MGSTNWSHDLYNDRATIRSSNVANYGTDAAFSYTYAIKTGAAPRAVNAAMDPKRTAGAKSPFVGSVMRESRDSDDHPESLAIAVFFDVTGSMHTIPVTLEKKLGGLMALLLQKGYVAHPQILFGAIGDANCDSVPLQVGQFESGVEMDDDLDKIFLEGGGGGHHHETYELAHYFMWKHSAIDCWEKRGQKGFFFSIGDEAPYDFVRKNHVHSLIGDTIQSDIPVKEVFDGIMERYEVFHFHAQAGSYRDRIEILDPWRQLLGERVVLLEDPDNVAEMIASTIGLTLGTTDVDRLSADLAVMGSSAAAAHSVSQALATYARSVPAARTGGVTGTLPSLSASGGATRL